MSNATTNLEAKASLRWQEYAELCRRENGDPSLKDSAPFQKRKIKACAAFQKAFARFCNG